MYLLLVNNLKQFLINQDILEEEEKKYSWDFSQYWTLNYGDFLFMFIKSPFKKNIQNNSNNNNSNNSNNENYNINNNNINNNINNNNNNNSINTNINNNNNNDNNIINNGNNNNNNIINNDNNSENINTIKIKEGKEKIKEDDILYLKIYLREKKIINLGKITILNNDETNKEKIIELNFSIKDELIYMFYIIENIIDNTKNYNLYYKIYTQSSMSLLKEKEIKLEKNFIPSKLFGDEKFLYCFSNSNQVLMIKKHYKMKYQQYINCSINLFDKDIKLIKELKNLEAFIMHTYRAEKVTTLE